MSALAEDLRALLHNVLISTGHVAHAALIRRRDGNVRAKSPGFPRISADELEGILNAFKDQKRARETPLVVARRRYRCIRVDSAALYAKEGALGVIIAPTTKCLLIALYTKGMAPSICAEATEVLAAYLNGKRK